MANNDFYGGAQQEANGYPKRFRSIADKYNHVEIFTNGTSLGDRQICGFMIFGRPRMSKAAELAALIGSQTALSNRNLIINGAMQAQRGTRKP